MNVLVVAVVVTLIVFSIVIAVLIVAFAMSVALAVALRQRVLAENQAAHNRSAYHPFCQLHASLLENRVLRFKLLPRDALCKNSRPPRVARLTGPVGTCDLPGKKKPA